MANWSEVLQQIQTLQLNVKSIESDKSSDKDFQDLVLTVHHCYMHSLMNTPSFKMIENHMGAALVKQQRAVIVQQPS